MGPPKDSRQLHYSQESSRHKITGTEKHKSITPRPHSDRQRRQQNSTKHTTLVSLGKSGKKGAYDGASRTCKDVLRLHKGGKHETKDTSFAIGLTSVLMLTPALDLTSAMVLPPLPKTYPTCTRHKRSDTRSRDRQRKRERHG